MSTTRPIQVGDFYRYGTEGSLCRVVKIYFQGEDRETMYDFRFYDSNKKWLILFFTDTEVNHWFTPVDLDSPDVVWCLLNH